MWLNSHDRKWLNFKRPAINTLYQKFVAFIMMMQYMLALRKPLLKGMVIV